jgi:hypothetical protein
MHDDPRSARGFTHSGDQASLVNEKNLDKTKKEYNIQVNWTAQRKDTEGKHNAKQGGHPS